MKISIITVGKIKEKYFIDAVSEYKKRLQAYAEIEIIEVADEKIPDKASLKEEELIKRKEGDKLLQKIKKNDFVVLLDLHGKEMDSISFSNFLDNKMTEGVSSFSFVIGGSLGLSKEVIERANFRLCLSPMTFTHQFTRVIILEQIYRAFKILHHETYHK